MGQFEGGGFGRKRLFEGAGFDGRGNFWLGMGYLFRIIIYDIFTQCPLCIEIFSKLTVNICRSLQVNTVGMTSSQQ